MENLDKYIEQGITILQGVSLLLAFVFSIRPVREYLGFKRANRIRSYCETAYYATDNLKKERAKTDKPMSAKELSEWFLRFAESELKTNGVKITPAIKDKLITYGEALHAEKKEGK